MADVPRMRSATRRDRGAEPTASSSTQTARVGRSPEASERPFRTLFAASPDAIVLIDPHDPDISWPIVECNEAACRMNGYERDELVGRSIDVLNLMNGTPEERRVYLERLRHDGAIRIETEHRRKDGEVFPVEVSTTLVTLEGRELVLGVDRDISERRDVERQLREAHEALRLADEARGRLLARLLSAQEEERSRVANEVHDDSIQVLTAVGVRLSTVSSQLGSALDPVTAQTLCRLQETVEGAIFRLRKLVFELRPPSLEHMGLAAALREYVDRTRELGAPVVTIEGRFEHEPPLEARVLLYRIAQEALTNVRKHAKARSLRIALESEGDGAAMRIEDDGVGFDPTDIGDVPGRVGLISMRERAELAGGWFRVSSSAGKGTIVSFLVPDLLARRSEEPQPAFTRRA